MANSPILEQIIHVSAVEHVGYVIFPTSHKGREILNPKKVRNGNVQPHNFLLPIPQSVPVVEVRPRKSVAFIWLLSVYTGTKQPNR